jgi:hypothetical protein
MRKIIFIALTMFMLSSMTNAQTSLPWTEDFETTTGSSLPPGWTSTIVFQTTTATNWVSIASTTGTPQAAPNGGNRKARFFGSINGHKARLSTPSLDLSVATAPLLSFWHAQRYLSYPYNQDTLRVVYRTSAGGEWKLLKEFKDSLDWTETILLLPEQSADYSIGFEGTYRGGSGIHLDNVRVFESSPTPQFYGSNQLNFSTLFSNLPQLITRELSITNTGSQPLIISQSPKTDAVISIPNLTIAPGQTDFLQVTISPFGLPLGNYSGNLVLETNDPDNSEVTIGVTATISEVFISDFIFEDWEVFIVDRWWGVGGNTAYRFERTTGIGFNNSAGIRTKGLNATNNVALIQSPYIRMGTDPKISFQYRIAQDNNGTIVAPVGSFTGELHISKDFGANWDTTLLNLDVSTVDWKRTPIFDASEYADEICLIKIEFKYVNPSGGIRIWLDNIVIGTDLAKNLTAVSISGSNMPEVGTAEPYKVVVQNNGTATQTATDYNVVLMRDDGIVIQTLPGQDISYLEIKEFEFSWIPTATGPSHLYAVVEYTNPLYDGDTTNRLAVNVQPANLVPVELGNGSDLLRLPYNFLFRRSVTQTLYYPHEILTNGGLINALTYSSNLTSPTIGNTETIIQIWIGETDKKDLSDGWVTPSTLTKVFDGAIRFSEGNKVTVNIPLDAPYPYNGGTLVVYSYKQHPNDYFGQNHFYGVSEQNTARSRTFQTDVDNINLNNPPTTGIQANVIDGLPNTIFRMNFEGMGSISGVVTDGTTPVPNVKVQVVGTNLFVMTDATGAYSFPHLLPNGYEIEVSKHGYFTQTTNEITLQTDGVVTKNITIVPIPQHIVSGKVITNYSDAGLANVKVTLSGYDNYSTTTDDNGEYSISGVFEGFTYNMVASIYGFHTYNSTVEVENNTTRDITLSEMAFAVYNPSVAKDGDNVLISWTAPGYQEAKYVFDDGSFEDLWSINSYFVASLGNKFVVGEAGILTSIDLYGRHNPNVEAMGSTRTVTIDIYDENRNFVGRSDTFRIPKDAWLNIALNDIPYSGTFYAMVHWNFQYGSTNFLGFDTDGPNAKKQLDWLLHNGSWEVLHEAYPTRPAGVFGIRANAQTKGAIPTPVTYNATSKSETINPPTSLEGYLIYRFTEGSDESEWDEIATVTNLQYTDTDWPTLSEGTYQWAVVAKYANDNLSFAMLTNTLTKTATSIVEMQGDESIRVFPNPVQTEFVVMGYEVRGTENPRLEIFDMNGKRVHVKHLEPRTSNLEPFTINISHLPNGIYILKIGTNAVRIVKQ